MSSKTVYFELINENEEEPDYDDLAGIFPEDGGAALDDDGLEFYEVQVADIEVRNIN